MGGVEHQGAIRRRLICQHIENFVENSAFTPPNKTVVQGFVRAVPIRFILPLKSVLDEIDDIADDAPVIHTGSTVRTGKEWFDTFQLAFGKIKQVHAGNLPCLLQYPAFLSLKITSPDPISQGSNLPSFSKLPFLQSRGGQGALTPFYTIETSNGVRQIR